MRPLRKPQIAEFFTGSECFLYTQLCIDAAKGACDLSSLGGIVISYIVFSQIALICSPGLQM